MPRFDKHLSFPQLAARLVISECSIETLRRRTRQAIRSQPKIDSVQICVFCRLGSQVLDKPVDKMAGIFRCGFGVVAFFFGKKEEEIYVGL